MQGVNIMLLENAICLFLVARKLFVQELVIWNVAASIAVKLMFVGLGFWGFFKDFVNILKKLIFVCRKLP